MESKTPVTIARVSFEHEAVSLTAALEDAGIKACSQPVASAGLLAMPGAYGMPQHGFEVLVSENDAEKAKDIAAGMGFGSEPVEAVSEENEEAASAEAEETAEQPQEEVQKQAEDVEKGSPITGVLLTILALSGIAVFVWLCDFVIQWVMSLLR